MFTITVRYHMEDSQSFHTTEPALILASLNMKQVLSLNVERDIP